MKQSMDPRCQWWGVVDPHEEAELEDGVVSVLDQVMWRKEDISVTQECADVLTQCCEAMVAVSQDSGDLCYSGGKRREGKCKSYVLCGFSSDFFLQRIGAAWNPF